MKSIVHCVILYANEEEVFEHARNLSKQTVVSDIALVIVVNKKDRTDIVDFKTRLQSLNLDVFIYDPNENLGYLNGTIFGYNQFCKETSSLPKWVIISNTDIEFSSNTFYQDILSNNYSEDVWCIAPSVYNFAKKSYDNPEYIDRVKIGTINRLIYIYERPFLAGIYEKLANIKGRLARNAKQESQYIYSAKGCFFILRTEMADLLTQRKYRAIMYSEESYVSEIILQINKKIYYDSSIEIIHKESTVTGKLKLQSKAKYIAESLKVIREEFY